MSKKYFWLKLKDDFFTDKKIKKLRKIAGGDTYTIIYLKMQLLSLKNDGYLIFDELTSEFYEEIALELDEDEDNVKFTLMYLMNVGLVEEVDEKSLAMIETIGNIGKESESAKRVRALRERQKNEQLALQCNVTSVTEDVTLNVTEVTCNIEKEKEKDIEKEIKNKTVQQVEQNPIDEQFETWWKLYPRKMDKKAAKTKFKTAIKNNSFEVIMNGTRSYNDYIAFSNTQKEYIKLATTFLNQESFLNDYRELMVPKQRNNNYGHQPYVSQSHQQAFYGIEEEKEIIEVNLEDLPF